MYCQLQWQRRCSRFRIATRSGNTEPFLRTVGAIQSFEKLESRFIPSVGKDAPAHVYGLSVGLNTPFEEVLLPDALTAMVERTTVTAPAEGEEDAGSDKIETPVEGENTPNADEELNEETVAEDATDDTALSDHQPAALSETDGAVPGENEGDTTPPAPETEETETTVTTTEEETIPVTWSGDREYTPEQNSKVIYTAVLPEGYTLARWCGTAANSCNDRQTRKGRLNY